MEQKSLFFSKDNNFPKVKITKEMIKRAIEETKKRETAKTKTGKPAFRHHFTADEKKKELFNNVLGFIGEFAFSILVGQDWKANIRPSYETIDAVDIRYKGNIIDVKTERIDPLFLSRVITKTIKDNEKYASCIVPVGQINLLKKYNVIFFGCVPINPEDYEVTHIKFWYPLGWIEADKIIECPIAPKTPSGARIPYPGFQIMVKNLKSLNELKSVIPNKLKERKRSFDIKGLVIIDSTDIDSKKLVPVDNFELYVKYELIKELKRRAEIALKNGTGINLAVDNLLYSVEEINDCLNFKIKLDNWENVLPWDEKKAYNSGFFQIQFWLPENKAFVGDLKKVIEEVIRVSDCKKLKRINLYVRKPLVKPLLEAFNLCFEKRCGIMISANMSFRVEETNSWRGIEHKFELYSKELGNNLGLKLIPIEDLKNILKINFKINKNVYRS
jgi:hypothetical protein